MSALVPAVRPGTRANKALCVLQSLAGQATKPEWMAAMGWKSSPALFDQDVMFMLTQHRLVFRRGDIWAITDDGRRVIGIDPDMDSGAGAPVPSRAVPEWRPLARRNVRRLDMVRDGGLDYQDIPSRFGDTSIPHRKA
jgi:hypothetical protein